MAKELTGGEASSCAAVAIHMMLIQPIWYVLFFAILQRVNAEPWMWVCYWIYVPSAFVGAMLTQLAKSLLIRGK